MMTQYKIACKTWANGNQMFVAYRVWFFLGIKFISPLPCEQSSSLRRLQETLLDAKAREKEIGYFDSISDSADRFVVDSLAPPPKEP